MLFCLFLPVQAFGTFLKKISLVSQQGLSYKLKTTNKRNISNDYKRKTYSLSLSYK